MEQNSTDSPAQYTLSEVLKNPKTALITTFLVLLILCTLVGNFLVIWNIFTTRRLRFSAFFFVASLAVADFLVGLVVLPISLAYHLTFEMTGRWIFGSWTCKAWLLSNFWFCSASILNLCLVSWDRYVAVTSPLYYKVRISDTRVKTLIGMIWFLSFCLAIVLSTGIHLNSASSTKNCTVQSLNKIFTAIGVVFVFFLPAIFLGFVNTRVWLITRTHQKRIQVSLHLNSFSNVSANSEQINLDETTTARSSSRPRESSTRTLTRTIKQEIKTFKTFLIVIGVFVVCWCPFYTSMLVDIFKPLQGFVLFLMIILSYCNSALNVFIYGIFSREFRSALISTVKCI
ncbi:probable G-protein coupled receptor No9 [Actinia tenebrosa]|uniref:Probable G-protein coupled receptor No9 n=1 Tax=Actinia tenebrosa TaxID=6105 RepID=A0A6P8HX63_ACTTE|nr:probable G-protein coupled receptor No9 [Actinia tenebrosa]